MKRNKLLAKMRGLTPELAFLALDDLEPLDRMVANH